MVLASIDNWVRLSTDLCRKFWAWLIIETNSLSKGPFIPRMTTVTIAIKIVLKIVLNIKEYQSLHHNYNDIDTGKQFYWNPFHSIHYVLESSNI